MVTSEQREIEELRQRVLAYQQLMVHFALIAAQALILAEMRRDG